MIYPPPSNYKNSHSYATIQHKFLNYRTPRKNPFWKLTEPTSSILLSRISSLTQVAKTKNSRCLCMFLQEPSPTCYPTSPIYQYSTSPTPPAFSHTLLNNPPHKNPMPPVSHNKFINSTCDPIPCSNSALAFNKSTHKHYKNIFFRNKMAVHTSPFITCMLK